MIDQFIDQPLVVIQQTRSWQTGYKLRPAFVLAVGAAQEGHGQTQIACYTVPLAKTAYIKSALIQVDSTRPATIGAT